MSLNAFRIMLEHRDSVLVLPQSQPGWIPMEGRVEVCKHRSQGPSGWRLLDLIWKMDWRNNELLLLRTVL